MGSIVERQSLGMQEYRYAILKAVSEFFELFGVRRPIRHDPPPAVGECYDAVHVDHPAARLFLEQHLDFHPAPEPRLGGGPQQTAEPELP